MNRLWVVTECYPKPGGLNHCIFAHRQMRGLNESGWDVRVLIPNGWFPPLVWPITPAWRHAHDRAIPAGWTVDGIRVSDLPFQNRVPSRFCRPLDVVARIGNALDAMLTREEARGDRDMVLSQFALPYGPAVREACRRRGLRYVVHLRGDDVWIWPHQAPEKMNGFRETVSDAALVLGVSKSIVDEAGVLAGHPLPRRAVVPNGLDLNLLRPPTHGERDSARKGLGIDAGSFVVGCVAAAIARKGWRELIEAMASLNADNLVLLAAVSSLEADIDLAKEAARLAPKVRLVVKADIPQRVLASIYQASDLFCLPTWGEGMSNALLEAMAAGLPVITTAVGGHPEAVSHGVEGFLVEPHSVEQLATALSMLLENEALRRWMSAASRRRAESIGTSADAGRRLSKLFNQVLDQNYVETVPGLNPYAPVEVVV